MWLCYAVSTCAYFSGDDGADAPCAEPCSGCACTSVEASIAWPFGVEARVPRYEPLVRGGRSSVFQCDGVAARCLIGSLALALHTPLLVVANRRGSTIGDAKRLLPVVGVAEGCDPCCVPRRLYSHLWKTCSCQYGGCKLSVCMPLALHHWQRLGVCVVGNTRGFLFARARRPAEGTWREVLARCLRPVGFLTIAVAEVALNGSLVSTRHASRAPAASPVRV